MAEKDEDIQNALLASEQQKNTAEGDEQAVGIVAETIDEELPEPLLVANSVDIPSMEVANTEQYSKIVLEGAQTISNVAELYERLVSALNNRRKIDIDASAVATIDTATLQLLLVLKQSSAKMQKEVSIDFPSERFVEAADLLGLSELLDIDQAFAGLF